MNVRNIRISVSTIVVRATTNARTTAGKFGLTLFVFPLLLIGIISEHKPSAVLKTQLVLMSPPPPHQSALPRPPTQAASVHSEAAVLQVPAAVEEVEVEAPKLVLRLQLSLERFMD